MALSRSALTSIATVLSATLAIVNFSYDAGMMNQLLISERYFEYFALDSTWIGLCIAIVNVGNLVIAPFVGPLMDSMGRKRTIWLGNCIGMVGVAIQAAAQNIGMLLAGRTLVGISLGINGVCAPTLVAEAATGHLHAILANVTMVGLPFTGIVVSAAGIAVYESDTDWGWRGIILGEAIAPFLSCFVLLLAPESPRWLVYKDRADDAKRVLDRIHPATEGDRDDVIRAEYEEIAQTIEFERQNNESFRALIEKPSDRRRFIIAILTNVFYQTCGANTLPYFFTLVLASLGISETYTVLYLNLGLTVWGALSVVSGVWICHRFGSRTIMLTNTSIVTVCLALLAVLTALGPENGRGHGAIAVTFIFWWAAASCWMILEYTYPVEILRFSLRGKGTALAQLIGYLFQLMLNYTLPMALERIGWKFYAINAIWDAGTVVIIWWLFVETKGKTLEEVDAIFDGTVHFQFTDAVEVIHSSEKEASKKSL